MAKTDYQTVDEYIETFPDDVQAVLRKLRATIRQAVPGAEERISYQIPAYHLAGRLFYFAAWQRHYSLYPATEALVAAFGEELAAYEVTKGTIKFPYDRPVPVRLIAAMAKHRAAENRRLAEERAAVKRKK